MLRAEEDVRMSVEEEGQEDIGDLVRMWGQNVQHENEWRYWGLSVGRVGQGLDRHSMHLGEEFICTHLRERMHLR